MEKMQDELTAQRAAQNAAEATFAEEVRKHAELTERVSAIELELPKVKAQATKLTEEHELSDREFAEQIERMREQQAKAREKYAERKAAMATQIELQKRQLSKLKDDVSDLKIKTQGRDRREKANLANLTNVA